MAIFAPTIYYFQQPIQAAVGGAITATGGQISQATINGILYKIHTFTSSGDFVVSSGGDSVDYLIVAGGGGGGGNNFASGERGGAGGGGAGGAQTGSISVSPQTYAVAVGAGGAGAPSNSASPGSNGVTSSFGGVTSTGGGGGASALSRVGQNGGSGGGGSADASVLRAGGTGTAGQGKNGGAGAVDPSRPAGGGGGGAAVAGSAGNVNDGGNGGNGLQVNFTGTNTYYAGGGGGSPWQEISGDDVGIGGLGGGGNACSGSTGTPAAGVDGLGGGGGGGRKSTGGAKGGNGIVIIKYPTAAPDVVTNGLVIYMDATNPASYPGSGSSMFNLVAGQNYTASLVNSPTYKDNYIQLNGTNQYISIPHPGYTSGTSTVMGATRYADTAGNGRMFSGGVAGNNWLLGHWTNTTLNYYPGGTVAGVPGGPNDTNWRIYTGTAATATDRYDFYVNGVNSVTSSTAGANGLNTPMNVGRQGENNAEYSSGSFGFVLIYNRVLSPAEVTQNYNAFKSTVGLT